MHTRTTTIQVQCREFGREDRELYLIENTDDVIIDLRLTCTLSHQNIG